MCSPMLCAAICLTSSSTSFGTWTSQTGIAATATCSAEAMNAAAIFDLLLDKLEMKLSQEALLELADWIAKLIEASYREGREDGQWEA